MRPFPRIFAGALRPPLARSLAAVGSLLASAALSLALAPAAGAKVYLTDFPSEGGTGIERAAFDGSDRQSLEFQPIGFADGLALAMAAGKMYWTETSAGAIWRANLNGTEAETVLIDSGREPLGIALDLAHQQIYWTDTEGVKRAKLDGTGAELLTKEQARGFISLDLSTRQMFWADWPSGTIRTAPMESAPPMTTIAKGQPCAFGIAVDEAGGTVYWLPLEVKERPRCGKNASISRAKLDGSAPETILKRPGAGFEGGLAVDPTAGKIYWTEAEAHDVRSANLDGSGEDVLFGTGGDFPVAIAVESGDPRPVNTTAPVIEGNPVVGSPLSCNPGTWTGIGPIALSWQWMLAGGEAIEGATTSSFVAPSELAGASVRCVVTAADSVETTAAESPAVTIGPYPSPPEHEQLVAGLALARLVGHRSRVRVPMFTSLAGVATLEAIPRPTAGPARAHRQPSRGRSRSHTRARVHGAGGLTLVATRTVHAGRNTIALSRLKPGSLYELRLTVESADGQTATSSGWLRVARS